MLFFVNRMNVSAAQRGECRGQGVISRVGRLPTFREDVIKRPIPPNLSCDPAVCGL